MQISLQYCKNLLIFNFTKLQIICNYYTKITTYNKNYTIEENISASI